MIQSVTPTFFHLVFDISDIILKSAEKTIIGKKNYKKRIVKLEILNQQNNEKYCQF